MKIRMNISELFGAVERNKITKNEKWWSIEMEKIYSDEE